MPVKKLTAVLTLSLLASVHLTLAQETTSTLIIDELPGTPDALLQEVPEPFPDVEEGHPNFVAVTELRKLGLIEGYPDGKFRPYNEINRAEALKVLMKAMPNDQLSTNPEHFFFPDVTPSDWFFDYTVMAFNAGLVEGYPDGKFHPEQTINLVESLKITLIHEGEPIPETVEEPPYSDVDPSEWYAAYAQISSERDLVIKERNTGKLYPDKKMNRGEFIEMIYHLLQSREGSMFTRASWYGSEGVNWGTASGEKFDTNKMAAAHRTLPFGTELEVTNLANGKKVNVVVNDRGPYVTGLDLDLTSGAFEKIASLGSGLIFIEYRVIDETETDEEIITQPLEYGF